VTFDFSNQAIAPASVPSAALIQSVVSDPTALANLDAGSAASLAGNSQGSAALTSAQGAAAIAANPAALNAIAAANPDVLSQILAQVQNDPTLSQAVLTAALEQPHVSQVTLTSGTSATNVQLTVKEFLPTSTDQTAVTTQANEGLTSIILKVAAQTPVGNVPTGSTASGSTTETLYQPLKILQIDVSGDGIQHGSVGATIQFTVTQAELDAMHVQAGDIALLHQVNGQWVALTTTLVSHSGSTYTFSAQTPSFSYFAVAGRVQSAEVTQSGLSALGITALVLALIAIVAIVAVAVKRKNKQQ